jgi:hypothetical protein
VALDLLLRASASVLVMASNKLPDVSVDATTRQHSTERRMAA